uniref:DUF3071 domain-containing protein n=1 Tax=Janibacter limosus TaxID=53458 RepID=A0AC61U7P8_9MICO|nr:septation protein SepH [Janibacter limosus]
MRDLRLIGVHDDGEHLVVTDDAGEEYRLRIDEPLRAAARRDRPRLGQLQIAIDNDVRPREVQAMIRAGASAEEVAARTGWDPDKIARFEGPVIAEREHVATRAQSVRMRGTNRSRLPRDHGATRRDATRRPWRRALLRRVGRLPRPRGPVDRLGDLRRRWPRADSHPVVRHGRDERRRQERRGQVALRGRRTGRARAGRRAPPHGRLRRRGRGDQGRAGDAGQHRRPHQLHARALRRQEPAARRPSQEPWLRPDAAGDRGRAAPRRAPAARRRCAPPRRAAGRDVTLRERQERDRQDRAVQGVNSQGRCRGSRACSHDVLHVCALDG